jgi:hypothetical protein
MVLMQGRSEEGRLSDEIQQTLTDPRPLITIAAIASSRAPVTRVFEIRDSAAYMA